MKKKREEEEGLLNDEDDGEQLREDDPEYEEKVRKLEEREATWARTREMG